jgi:hypothetical protein
MRTLVAFFTLCGACGTSPKKPTVTVPLSAELVACNPFSGSQSSGVPPENSDWTTRVQYQAIECCMARIASFQPSKEDVNGQWETFFKSEPKCLAGIAKTMCEQPVSNLSSDPLIASEEILKGRCGISLYVGAPYMNRVIREFITMHEWRTSIQLFNQLGKAITKYRRTMDARVWKSIIEEAWRRTILTSDPDSTISRLLKPCRNLAVSFDDSSVGKPRNMKYGVFAP